jgi:NAD(P) transhydrogenase subunit alpha
VKEQVESLGAKFIDVSYDTPEEKEAAEGVGGYAKPMPQSWLDRQKVEVAKRVAQADVVITTALIPGRPAPVLVTEDMVKHEAGLGDRRHGGAPGRQLPADRSRQDGGQARRDAGRRDQPARTGGGRRVSAVRAQRAGLPEAHLPKEGALKVDMEDDIVAACLMTQTAKSSASEESGSAHLTHGHRFPHHHST